MPASHQAPNQANLPHQPEIDDATSTAAAGGAPSQNTTRSSCQEDRSRSISQGPRHDGEWWCFGHGYRCFIGIFQKMLRLYLENFRAWWGESAGQSAEGSGQRWRATPLAGGAFKVICVCTQTPSAWLKTTATQRCNTPSSGGRALIEHNIVLQASQSSGSIGA